MPRYGLGAGIRGFWPRAIQPNKDRPSAGAMPQVEKICGVFFPDRAEQNCMKTGGKYSAFSPVVGAKEITDILSTMGGRREYEDTKPPK